MVTTIPRAVLHTHGILRTPATSVPASLLSARASLAKARQDRATAEAEFHKASQARCAAQSLVAVRDRISLRIADIERINKRLVERWAKSGGVGAPELQGEAELGALRHDFIEAERLAAAADNALPDLMSGAEAARQSVSATTIALCEAIVAIIAEEMKLELEAICEEERRTTKRRATMAAAVWALDLLGASYPVPNAGALARLLHLNRTSFCPNL